MGSGRGLEGRGVRLEDIAKRLGVSKMTVSLALRNDFAVAEGTRRKVKDLAAKLGYRRDPLLSLHMSKLRRGGSSRFRPALAFLNPHPVREELLGSPAQTAFLKGAQERAAELGYVVEELWLGDPALKSCSLKTYFKRKGVHGFISLGEPDCAKIPWDCFPSAVVGYTRTKLGLHRVCNNQYHSSKMAVERMSALGFRRLGMALSEKLDSALEENYSSAFLAYNSRIPPRESLPLFRAPEWDKEKWFEWLDSHKPEAVLANEIIVCEWTLEYNRARKAKVVPVALAHNRLWGGCPGVDQKSLRVGATSLEIVVQQINMGLSGIPAEPWLILLEGEWVPGKGVVPPGRRSGLP